MTEQYTAVVTATNDTTMTEQYTAVVTATNDTTMPLSEIPLQTIWDVEGDLTETLWWPVDDKARAENENTLVFFMIPGNPGVIPYYTPFLSTIYKELEEKIQIVGVSHLGHSHDLNSSDNKIHTLQDQINHKIRCFDKLRKRFTSNNGRLPRFILCGHSVGSYICEQVLKARPDHGIEKVYALFPTIQHIKQTPNGKMLTLLFYERSRNFASPLVQSLRTIFAPHTLRFLVRLFTGQPDPFLSITTEKLLHGDVVKNALYMAATEMEEILDLDEEFYRENLDKYVFYFGQTDNWAPMNHYYDMVERFPDGKILLCEDGMAHAFIMDHSDILGQKVGRWIKDPASI